MIDLDILKDRGITEDSLRQKLAIDPLTTKNDEPVGQLIHRIRSRIQEGMSRNFQNFRTYSALDKAWDQPFHQISQTLIQDFINSDPNDDAVYKAMQDFGLTSIIDTRKDPKTGKEVKSLNLPTFFQIFVPLVKAYVTIRWAKIMNDRRLTPFFKFEPVKMTAAFSAICEALTDRVQIMSNQYDYFSVMKQAVLKMLHYGFCIQFPHTEWHYEQQWKSADEADVAMKKIKADGNPASVGDPIKVTTSEGIYYHLPHPTRIFWDLAHSPYTLNSGQHGCEYAGYWRICRYREILEGDYWNKERIALGTVDLIANHQLFFNTVYASCTLKFPTKQPPKLPDGPQLAAELGVGTASTDREAAVANLYYGTDHGDQGTLVTQYFERLIPSKWGLGDYDCPVWFRFVVAGDMASILYAAPLPYSPTIYYGYDPDESKTKNSSLSLEVLPFQDHFSQMLSQIILTCKQNLANLTFVDEDQFMTGDDNAQSSARKTIDKISNIGEGLYRTINIYPYSSKKMQRMQLGRQGMPDVVQSFNLPKGNIQELTQVLREILDILERVLVMSSQEIAQAASHELRVDEVRNIAASTSSRLLFTATPVDIARDAWKRQIYNGLMAYGDEDIWVHLPADIPLSEEQLTKLGFTVHRKGMQVQKDRFILARISKDKTAIPLWAIAQQRDGDDRMDNEKLAVAMAQFIGNCLGNPMLSQAIGPEQAIELADYVMKLAGFPKDFRLRNTGPSTVEMQQQQQMQEVQMVVQEALKAIQPELKPLLDATIDNEKRIELIIDTLKQINLKVPNPTDDSGPSQTNGGNGGGSASRLVSPAGVPLVATAP
jgi:hypothetical protein